MLVVKQCTTSFIGKHHIDTSNMLEHTWQWILTAFAILISAYFYLSNKYSYFTVRGLQTPPVIWILGNLHQQMFADLHTVQYEWVKKYGKVFGFYFGTAPSVMIADPELVKQVIIKDFHHFVNRIEVNAYHEMWNKNLFAANADAWKRMRTITSPTFTSGKLRGMGSIMQTNIDKLNRYFERLTLSSGSGVMDTKKVISGFTIDVIASTAFATDTDANADDSGTHPFVINGRRLFDINTIRGVAAFMLPKSLLKLIGLETFWHPETFNFFIDLARHIVAQRKLDPNSKRNDLVQMMIDATVDENELDNINYESMTASDGQDKITKNETSKNETSIKQKLTDTEIIANCIIFFIAGYETTASTISHCIYELATNQDIQSRLNEDLCQALGQLEGKEDCDDEYFNTVINGIPYLEAVIKETLRRYPPVPVLSRLCSKDGYQLTRDLTLDKGQLVQISVSGIHLNPEYYPEPTRFKPERFLPENKSQLVPYSYLPFSAGPRNCIAVRFAYQEIKLCLADIVRKYRFDTTPETPDKLTFKPSGGSLLNSNPFPIKVVKR